MYCNYYCYCCKCNSHSKELLGYHGCGNCYCYWWNCHYYSTLVQKRGFEKGKRGFEEGKEMGLNVRGKILNRVRGRILRKGKILRRVLKRVTILRGRRIYTLLRRVSLLKRIGRGRRVTTLRGRRISLLWKIWWWWLLIIARNVLWLPSNNTINFDINNNKKHIITRQRMHKNL